MKGSNPLEVLKSCGACYESPRGADGRILGPIVAYAGKYKTEAGEEKQWVGPDYFNFAKAEEDPEILAYFAQILASEVPGYIKPRPTLVIGMPMGGILLSGAIGHALWRRAIFAEKKVTALADPDNGLKEQSILVVDRHEIFPGDNIFIVEDVCNNFSTTQKIVDLISSRGAQCVGIFCAVNRSPKEDWNGLPIVSAIFRPSEQYKQEDQAVAELIAEGKIVWKPKHQWDVLKAAMKA